MSEIPIEIQNISGLIMIALLFLAAVSTIKGAASPSNYDHLHLNVLKTYAIMFPNVILGLSDHTHAKAPVLGAVTLGARVIERHFTDSNDREGPDHKFAMNPEKWAEMVAETRLLERSLGSTDKFIAGNEAETAVIQRRCLRASKRYRGRTNFLP